jgi:signal transduction histidine kinase
VNPTLWSVSVAAFWAVIGGAAAWFATIPLRRRTLGGLLAAVVLTGTIASISALVGSERAMFLSSQELAGSVTVALVAGLVTAASAALAARRLARDNRALRDAVAQVGAGRVPQADGRRLTAELEGVRVELAETASRLAKSREREQALEAARRELVAWVSHDLRAPLAGIRAMSEALEDGVAASPELYYKQMQAAVDRLTTMVDDLFELSRLQSGKLPLESEPVPLSDLISDCLATLDPLAAAQGVTLTGRTDGSGPAVVGSVRELSRALTNLLANAIRHTSRGGRVEARVSCRAGRAVVAVQDECGGIPAQELDRVFDVGFRGEPARTPGQPSAGSGLGLAIARGIVEAHSGNVGVQNTPGGCVFTIELPTAP